MADARFRRAFGIPKPATAEVYDYMKVSAECSRLVDRLPFVHSSVSRELPEFGIVALGSAKLLSCSTHDCWSVTSQETLVRMSNWLYVAQMHSGGRIMQILLQ